MIETITAVNDAVNHFIWGIPAMISIIGVGLLLSVRTRFLQIRKFPYAIKTTIGRMFRKKDATDGAMTPFQAVCTALAATVGTGNIAGVAGAIAIGGPGAVFWMWCSALLGMCTKFSEVTLAVRFRERSATGEWVGGPMYYIKNGLSKNWHWLAAFYSLFGVLTVFGTGNATQVNTIVTAIDSALTAYGDFSKSMLSTVNLVAGVLVAMLVAMVLLGGIKRIGSVTEKLVPFMALFYVVLALGVVILNIRRFPAVLASIVGGAFDPRAFTGGAIGSVFLSMQKGVSRGIFSNEAGVGSAAMVHCNATVQHPMEQAVWGPVEVFLDTVLVCSVSGIAVVMSGLYTDPDLDGARLTMAAFDKLLPGSWGGLITLGAVLLFGFSCLITFNIYVERGATFVFGEKVRPLIRILWVICVFVGAISGESVVWDIADTVNGIIIFPNLIALWVLSKELVAMKKEWTDPDMLRYKAEKETRRMAKK